MKKIFTLLAFTAFIATSSCQKKDSGNGIPSDLPRTNVPGELQGKWMYGQFSTTEYWSQNPATYLGNAFEFAIAFNFKADGTYEQYFTSGNVSSGVTTYQQSVTKGTVEVNTAAGTFRTHPASAHYKRTRNGQVIEERDLAKSELSAPTNYSYTTGTETNGTKALYVTLEGTGSSLAFLKK